MKKIEIFLINAFFSALIGAAVEVTAVYVKNEEALILSELIQSMLAGICIGTVVLAVFMLIILKYRGTPRVGYLANFLTVAVLFLAGAFYEALFSAQGRFDLRTLVGIGVAEILSFLLLKSWYGRFHKLNLLLEMKRESISSNRTGGPNN